MAEKTRLSIKNLKSFNTDHRFIQTSHFEPYFKKDLRYWLTI